MPKKRHKAEEIVAKLRQVEVLSAQGQSIAEAIRSIGVTEVTYYRWRSEYGGLKGDQVKRLAVSSPTLSTLSSQNGHAIRADECLLMARKAEVV